MNADNLAGYEGKVPIKIGEERREELVQLLATSLAEVRVDNGYWPSRLSVFLATYEARQALPQQGIHRDALEAFIDEDPLFEFVYEFLMAELCDKRGYVHEVKEEPITAIEGYADLDALADRLVKEIEKLPRKYEIVFQLPAKLVQQEILARSAFGVGPEGRLTAPDLVFNERYSLTHDNPNRASRAKGGGVLNALMIGDPKWRPDSGCVIYQTEGFIGIFGGGAPLNRHIDWIESFLGLGLAKSLISYSWKANNDKSTQKFHVFEDADGAAEFYTTIDASDDFSEVLRHLTEYEFPFDYPDESKQPWLTQVLGEIDQIFAHSENSRLLLAAKWFFESYKDSSPTLRYVRQMTCLEILLGSGFNIEKVGLGEMLANRLAYLIGRKYSDRQIVLREFKEVYNIRSRILHQGKHRLSQEERRLLSKLTLFCKRAIDSESRLILNEETNR